MIFVTVVGKELHQLSYVQMAGFRLHPGPLPEQYRMSMQVPTKKKQKKKKNKVSYNIRLDPTYEDGGIYNKSTM